MTATLNLRLGSYLGATGTSEGAVANVYAFDEAGERDPKRDHRNLVIPAGYHVLSLAVPVEPGEYLVEAVLPSGDVASDQVHVAEGANREVTLEGPQSPNEWLSWQQFIGNVPAEAEVQRTSPRARRINPNRGTAASQVERIERFIRDGEFEKTDGGGGFRAEGARSTFKTGGGTRSCRGGGRCGGGGGRCGGGGGRCSPGGIRRSVSRRSVVVPERPSPPEPKLPPWPTVWFIREPVTALWGDGPDGSAAWELLASPETRKDPLEALSAGPAKRSAHRNRRDEWEAHAFGGDGPLAHGQGATTGGDQTPRRYVLSIRSRGPVEVACLPVPWESGPYGQVPVEMLVRRQPLSGEAVLAMSPEDPIVRSALGYMGTGALANARLMFDQAKDMLFGKMINPLGAAAGGYVLLATEHGAGEHQWHEWIANLGNRFEWLPDGLIQYGRLRMMRRQGESDIEAARAAFFGAYDRGIPYYSLGLQWLVDGLSLLATRDKEAARRLAAVQEVAWRANLQQPFTTIRLRDR